CVARITHDTAPRIGKNHGPPGTRKPRSRPGSFTRRMMMPMQTSMKAKSVPMLVRSTISSSEEKSAATPTKTPVMIVEMCGVRYFGCTFEKKRQEAVARHGEEDARLTELENEQHGRVGDDG